MGNEKVKRAGRRNTLAFLVLTALKKEEVATAGETAATSL
jgi:hypothetical protein